MSTRRLRRANLVALQHIDVVDPWVVEHKTFIEKTYNDRGQQRTDGDIIKEHDDNDEVAAHTTRRSRTTLPKGRLFHRRTPFAKKKSKKIVNR